MSIQKMLKQINGYQAITTPELAKPIHEHIVNKFPQHTIRYNVFNDATNVNITGTSYIVSIIYTHDAACIDVFNKHHLASKLQTTSYQYNDPNLLSAIEKRISSPTRFYNGHKENLL